MGDAEEGATGAGGSTARASVVAGVGSGVLVEKV